MKMDFGFSNVRLQHLLGRFSRSDRHLTYFPSQYYKVIISVSLGLPALPAREFKRRKTLPNRVRPHLSRSLFLSPPLSINSSLFLALFIPPIGINVLSRSRKTEKFTL